MCFILVQHDLNYTTSSVTVARVILAPISPKFFLNYGKLTVHIKINMYLGTNRIRNGTTFKIIQLLVSIRSKQSDQIEVLFLLGPKAIID